VISDIMENENIQQYSVKNNIDFIKKEAEDNGVEPIVFPNQKPSTKLLTLKESLKVRMLNRPYTYDDLVIPFTNILHETWNKDFNDGINIEEYVEAKDYYTIFIGKAIAEHRLEQSLENIRLVFKIDGIPRYLTHQIVRHRRMTFSQESFRVVDIRNHPVIVPQTIATDNVLLHNYREAVEQCKLVYSYLVDAGIPPEEARAVMPMGTATGIIMSTDLNALLSYLNWRGAGELVQPEHRFLAKAIYIAFKEHEPFLFSLVSKMIKDF
jgi:flavin-dependent thymidylate synthase